MNTHSNDNRPFPPIQLLVPTCPAVDAAGMNLSWLHGYCVMTLQPVGSGVRLSGELRVGERYGQNLSMIRDLAAALIPDAVLAGYDLTDSVSTLGRLPIEANDPQPALEVLAKLKSMLEAHDPIDLAIDDYSQTEVTLQHLRHQLGSDDPLNAEDDLFEIGMPDDDISILPHRVAAALIEGAGAYLLAIGEMYLADELRPALSAAWGNWELSAQSQLLTLTLDQENGGDLIIIT